MKWSLWDYFMPRNATFAHPSPASTAHSTLRESEEFPTKVQLDGAAEAPKQPVAWEPLTTHSENSSSRRGTPKPAPTQSEVIEAVATSRPVRAPVPVRAKRYSTTNASQRGTPALPSNQPSSFPSTTPTITGSLEHGAPLKRSDSARVFDASERKELYRKRRNAEEDTLRTALAEKETLRTTLSEKEKTIQSLTQQLYNARAEVVEGRKKSTSVQRGVQNLLDEKSKLLSQLQGAQKEAAEKERQAAKKIGELETANRKKDEELRITLARLRASEEKQLNTAKLLEVRTNDLNSVQPFLTTADTYSGAEIMAMVETLNAEIFQTAAYMAELVEDESMAASEYERNNVDRARQAIETQLRGSLGDDLWKYLKKKHIDIRTEPLPLQLAFQGVLSIWAAHKARTFLMGYLGDNLGKIYQMIRESEAQAVAGRWRALTNAKLSAFKDEPSPDVIVDLLISMLTFCGWSTSSEKSKKALLLMQQMIFNVGKLAGQIRTATKEEITTADFEACVVPPGSTLTGEMEDVYSDSPGGNASSGQMVNKRVLCAVGVGLRRTTVKQTERRTPEYKSEILLKPKVALVSVLESTRDGAESIKGKN